MKLKEAKAIAKQRGIDPGRMQKAELIRAMQRAESNNDCFGIAPSTGCAELECLWREDCLKESRMVLSS